MLRRTGWHLNAGTTHIRRAALIPLVTSPRKLRHADLAGNEEMPCGTLAFKPH
jgi:hypothetical protein